MNRRLVIQIALGLSGAFALAVATPALACDCDKKAGAADKAGAKPAAPAATDKAAPAQPAPAQEKKAEASKATGTLLAAADCKCGAKDPKDCKCEKGCKCQDKHGTTTDKPKASAAPSTLPLGAAADGCPCGAKTAAECKCGEKCKCHEKKDAPPAPKAKAA
jgi:hypothetical protein